MDARSNTVIELYDQLTQMFAKKVVARIWVPNENENMEAKSVMYSAVRVASQENHQDRILVDMWVKAIRKKETQIGGDV